MSQLTSITVNDGEDTPVSHTFAADYVDKNNVGRLREAGTYGDGDNLLSISNREGDIWRGRLVLTMPVIVEETINGVTVPKVARTAVGDLQLRFHKNSTQQERENMLVLISNMLAGGVSMVDDTFISRTGIY